MHFCKFLLLCSFVILIKTVSCSKNLKTEEVIYELARTLQDQTVNENVVISPLGATLALAQINQLSCCRFVRLLEAVMNWNVNGILFFFFLYFYSIYIKNLNFSRA